jgi:flagellar biosynthesis/type III secretory pathway chaperone
MTFPARGSSVTASQSFASTAPAIAQTIGELHRLLTEENAAIEGGAVRDHTEITRNKNRILRELMVVQRTITDPAVLSGVAVTMAEVRTLLTRNQQLLKANIAALKDITDIIKETALDAQGDGTYARNANQGTA